VRERKGEQPLGHKKGKKPWEGLTEKLLQGLAKGWVCKEKSDLQRRKIIYEVRPN